CGGANPSSRLLTNPCAGAVYRVASAVGRDPDMDFADAPEHAAFRREFRDWLAANLPDDLKVEDAQDQRISPDRTILEKRIAWQKKMHAAGWVGISWPKEYGGRGASFMQQVIWDEEYFRARAPILPCQSGLNLLGPTLIHWGSEEQKRRHLPRILSADEIGAGARLGIALAPDLVGGEDARQVAPFRRQRPEG